MNQLVSDIANSVQAIDASGEPFKGFQPGVGPYGEPQLLKKLVAELTTRFGSRYKGARTKREPDVLIPDRWALEFKIVRPFGDNGKPAEHWSQNLLHPYLGNVSAMGDALKLMRSQLSERKGLIVIAFEHSIPQVDLEVLFKSFELVCRRVLHAPLMERQTSVVENLIHPIHQRAIVHGWEIVTDHS